MWRRILARLALVLLAAAVIVAPVAAQNRPADRIQYGNQPEEPVERGPPVLPYTAALIALILVMLILCMPSRKRVIQ
jgi:hypothetical protein